MTTATLSYDEHYALGIAQMDKTHHTFIALINRLAAADKKQFMLLFPDLVAHTRDHFDYENILMENSGFPAFLEHAAEHRRVLGDMERLSRRVEQGITAMARAWVEQQVPEWFRLHLATMDASLATHLKSSRYMQQADVAKVTSHNSGQH